MTNDPSYDHSKEQDEVDELPLTPQMSSGASCSSQGERVPVPADEEQTEMISEPAKVMRIGSMVKQLLEEVRATPARRGEPGATRGGSTSARSRSSPRRCPRTCRPS